MGGELGVERVVNLLKDELKTCMQLGGAQTTEQIDRTFIVRHGHDEDVALSLEAGSIEAKAWHGEVPLEDRLAAGFSSTNREIGLA